MSDDLDKIKLLDFYTQDELNKWDIVIHKKVWDIYNSRKPVIGDITEIEDNKHIIKYIKDDDISYFFITKIIPNNNTDVLIKDLCQRLEDPEYRIGWVANIAMSYIDNERWYREETDKIGKYLNNNDKHIIATRSAEYFLKKLEGL